MSYIFFKSRYYTEEEFLDEQNDLENFLEHKDTEMWRKSVEGERKPADSVDQKELDEIVTLAKELADIDLSDKSWKIREEILYNLSSIFMLYDLQGKGLVNLDKLRAIADQLEEPLQEYLEEIL